MKIHLFSILIFALFSCAAMAQNVPSNVPINGLIGWWPLDGNINDSSGNGYNGMNSGATLATNRYNQLNKCLYFDNDWAEVQSIPFDLQQNFTFSYWQKLNLFNHTSCIIDINQNASCNLTPVIWQNIDSVSFGKCGSSVGLTGIVGQSEALNKWVMITFTSSSGVVNVYKNGVFYLTMSHSWPLTNSIQFTLGNAGNTGSPLHTQPSNIYLDDVGLWSRVLTQEEISILYQSPATNIKNDIAFKDNISIYPTVVNNQLTIETEFPNYFKSYKIFDVMGKEIMCGKIKARKEVIEMHSLSQGIYIISVDGLYSDKFIVLRD